MPVLLLEGLEPLVAEPQVEGQSGSHAPVILDKSGIDLRAQIIGTCPKANGGYLGQSEEKVGEVKARPGHRRAPGRKVAGGISAEGEGAARVWIGEGVELDAAQLAAQSQVMFAAVHQEKVEHAESLVAHQRGDGVVEAGKVGKGDDGQTPVSRVPRDVLNPQRACDILLEREGI